MKNPIYYDSTSVIAIYHNQIQHSMTKHIDIHKFHNCSQSFSDLMKSDEMEYMLIKTFQRFNIINKLFITINLEIQIQSANVTLVLYFFDVSSFKSRKISCIFFKFSTSKIFLLHFTSNIYLRNVICFSDQYQVLDDVFVSQKYLMLELQSFSEINETEIVSLHNKIK